MPPEVRFQIDGTWGARTERSCHCSGAFKTARPLFINEKKLRETEISMKCLILGGGGFIGTHLVDTLLEHQHEVRVFDRPNLKVSARYSKRENIEWFEGDFLNIEDISRAMKGCDILFHLAWSTLPKSSNENIVYDCETNLVATLRLLDAACKYNIKKVVFTSSGGTVYGLPCELPIKETHPTEPIVPYGITKLTVEKYLKLYKTINNLDFTVLRIANPFGERQQLTSAQGAVTIFLAKALKGETIEIWGDGNVVRDYIYIKDVAEALLKAMDYKGSFDVFNIGSGYGRSLNDIVSAIESLLERPVSCRYLPSRKFDVPANVLDISRANTSLGWAPKTSFEQGLIYTAEWLKDSET